MELNHYIYQVGVFDITFVYILMFLSVHSCVLSYSVSYWTTCISYQILLSYANM